MAITLYHRTTRQGLARIPREGFRSGPRGGVWQSRDLNAWGQDGEHLLVVTLDITDAELEAYGVDAVADEEWDEASGDWVKVAPEFVERFRWYDVPPEVVNARLAGVQLGHDRRNS